MEELATGETNLKKGLDLISEVTNQDLVVAAKVKAQNQVQWLSKYSGDLNNKLVRYSNGGKEFFC